VGTYTISADGTGSYEFNAKSDSLYYSPANIDFSVAFKYNINNQYVPDT
jgi:hypothetical protein